MPVANCAHIGLGGVPGNHFYPLRLVMGTGLDAPAVFGSDVHEQRDAGRSVRTVIAALKAAAR